MVIIPGLVTYSVSAADVLSIFLLYTLRVQYMDENARLRLMLDEWSARSAKLEIALNFQIRRGDGLQSQLLQMDEGGRPSA